jgi:hypothetical protein
VTCAELRERAVDPASSLQGGHATVVEHLESCANCRSVMRSFGAIDRLFRAGAPLESPADLDRRARGLLVTPQPGLPALLRSPAVVAVLVVIVLAAVLVLGRRSRTPGPSATPPASGARRAAARAGKGAPAILAVESTPVVVNALPLTEIEKKEALRLWDFDFLTWRETLAGLGPFFPSTIGPVPASGFLSTPSGARPPVSPDGVAGRLLEWRRTPKAQRARLVAANQSFLDLPESERAVLEERWTTVATLAEEERAGLRRLASRVTELDPKSARRLESDVRTIGLAQREERAACWRALPFAQTLTGQERESAERLLLSR